MACVSLATLAPYQISAPAAIPVPVVRSSADEDHGTAGWNRAGTIQFVAFSRKDPKTDRSNAFLRVIAKDGSFTTVKLNRAAEGDVGGFFHKRRVLYAELHKGSYDLRTYNIQTRRRWAPRDVNTHKHEWLPTRSGPYLLFNRDDRSGPRTRVVLRNLKTNDGGRVLARRGSWDRWLVAGQVSGDWAVWSACSEVCNVFKHNIGQGLTIMIPRPSDPLISQYDASVTADGVVYFVRSHARACDSKVEFVRFGASDPPTGTVISELPLERFTTGMYARRNPDRSVDLFFARGSCSTFRSDVFKLPGVQP